MNTDENIVYMNADDEITRLRSYTAELEARLAEKDAEIEGLRAELTQAGDQEEVRQALGMLEEANMKLTAANRRMKKHLRAASKVQASLLPERMPEAENAHFAWRYRPCEALAGDMLNVFRLDDSRIGLYLLDVSGHGAAAALHAVSISRLLVPMSLRSSWVREWDPRKSEYYVVPPGEVVDRLNRHFPWEEDNGQFFTLVYGVFDKKTLEFRYCNAGHPGPAHCRPGRETRIYPGTGLPVGLMPRAYDEQSVQLAPGDRIVLYSDGITEARSPAGELFGQKRMIEVLDGARSLEGGLDMLFAKLEEWRGEPHFEDDLTLLAIGVDPAE